MKALLMTKVLGGITRKWIGCKKAEKIVGVLFPLMAKIKCKIPNLF